MAILAGRPASGPIKYNGIAAASSSITAVCKVYTSTGSVLSAQRREFWEIADTL